MSDTKAVGTFDYDAPAELFPTRSRKGNRPMGYRRFAKAAEAVRFAIEQQSADKLVATVVEADDLRFVAEEIRALYDSAAYPLPRRPAS